MSKKETISQIKDHMLKDTRLKLLGSNSLYKRYPVTDNPIRTGSIILLGRMLFIILPELSVIILLKVLLI
jgi:hypothetical protein